MKPLFTIHAGEYLVGEYIEQNHRRWNVWVPSKDTGIDLLVTSAKKHRTVALQVKFSKDFTPGSRSPWIQNRITGMGWWTHKPQKLARSNADFWIFVLPSFFEKRTNFVIVPPGELLQRFRAIHGHRRKLIQSYLAVTRTKRCWETRGLRRGDMELIAFDRFSDSDRDFTVFLNAWRQIEKKLK
jgi:hypothetical protein